MYTNISEYCKEVLKRSSRTFATFFKVNDVKYCDIKKLKVSIPSVANGKITIGGTISNTVEIIVEKSDILVGTNIYVYESVQLDSGEYEDIPMGRYKISSAISKDCLTTIIADGPLSTETTLGYFSKLQYPATTVQILNEISELINVSIEVENLEKLYVEKELEGYTCREIIGFIAALHGTNAIETRDGRIAFRWYEHNEQDIFTDKSDTPELSNSLFSVDKLECTIGQTVITKGNGSTGIAISNPFMTEALADIVWKKIAGFTYRPATFQIKSGTPCIDSWDSFVYNNENVIATELEYVHDGGFQNVYKSAGVSEGGTNYKGPMTMLLERYQAELVIVKEALVNTLTVNEADIRYAQIEQLDVIQANVMNMVVGSIEGRYATLEYVNANYLTADKFQALSGRVNVLESNILTAESAIIKELQTNISKTNTLIFGSASGTSVQTEFSNSVIAQLGNAQIKSAMIADLSAEKITGLDLNTSKLTIHSADGKSTWNDNTIQISDGARVRVQIGKDASADYNMYVWDKTGNLMFDALGITEDGISRPIIRNDMVKENAGIDAKKLDISSLFKVINEDGSHTLSSTKIYVDTEGQNLNLAFKKMTTNVTAAQTTANNALSKADINANNITSLLQTVTTQGTELSVIQGQISSKIWKSDITTAVENIEVGGRNYLLNSSFENGIDKWFVTSGTGTITIINDGYNGNNALKIISTTTNTCIPRQYTNHIFKAGVPLVASAKIKVIEGSLNNLVLRFANTLSFTRVAVIPLDDTWYLYTCKAIPTDNIDGSKIVIGFMGAIGTFIIDDLKLEKGNCATDWTPAPEDIQTNIDSVENSVTLLNTQYSTLNQTVEGISSTVGSHSTQINVLDTRMVSAESNYTQLSSKFSWIVKSGTSASNFTITERMASLTAQYINLNGLVTFGGLDSGLSTAIQGAVKNVDVMYALGTSTTTAPTSGWSTTAPTWVSGKYMWQKTVTTYADGSTEETASTCISGATGQTGAKGATGPTGPTGAAGKGVKSINNYYLASSSSSGVTTSTSGWTTTIQTITTSKKYLWNYEVITYTDSTTTTTTPCIIGAYGNTGAKGETGATGSTGNGISSIAEYYAVSSSNSTAPTSWSTTVQTMTTTNKYLWNYEVITYTDGTTKETSKRVIGVYGNTGEKGATGATGATGAKGETGATGKGVKSIVEQYYLSSSSSSQTGGSWSGTCPAWKSGCYIWTRSYITWSDDTTSTTTPVLANGINSANTTANTASTNASSALSTANTANTNASNALSTANTANTNASTALSTANTANTNANSALNRATYHYGTCSTAAATTAKVVTLANFVLYTGAMISVYFTYANTASSPTLNVNGTGAKSIRVNNAAITSKYYWQANNTVTFIYNGTYWVMADTSANSILANWCSSSDKTLIDGAKIYTGSITAKKISVTSLETIVAKIGGFNINSTSLYNGTSSKTSTTAGIYVGTDAIRAYSSATAYTHIEKGKLTCVGAEIKGNLSVMGKIKMMCSTWEEEATSIIKYYYGDSGRVVEYCGPNGETVLKYATEAGYLSVSSDMVVNGEVQCNALFTTGTVRGGSVITAKGADLDVINNNLKDRVQCAYTYWGTSLTFHMPQGHHALVAISQNLLYLIWNNAGGLISVIVYNSGYDASRVSIRKDASENITIACTEYQTITAFYCSTY